MVKHTNPTPSVDWANSWRSLVVNVSISAGLLPVLIDLWIEHGQVKVVHPGDKFSA